MENKKYQVIIICGPTASGKTGLALQLAKELPRANILSVDSRQIYKDLDIITGKDIPENLPSNISIFGHDLFRPDERANLADFLRYSHRLIQDSIRSNTPLIIVGGTGLYLKALTQNLSDATIPPNKKLRDELEKLSVNQLQEILQKENSQKLTSLNHSDFMNPRRLIRYIEIERSKSMPSKSIVPTKNISFHWIGLQPDKNSILENIEKRVLERIKSGALEEVKKLQKNYPDNNLAIYTSLGVSQISEYLKENISQKQLIELWTRAEVDYARRQIVWFKKQPNIVWYDKDTDKSLLAKELAKIY